MTNLQDIIANEYFEWLVKLVGEGGHLKRFSYKKLLTRLHSIRFRYSISSDRNRAEDGEDLRHRFILIQGYEDSYDVIMDALRNPCSVLEMMIALAIRCEENIMDDPNIGDRTGQWFWGMITNLGLGPMTDGQYDRRFVDETVKTFLDRKYSPDGKGGLFTVRDAPRDLRTVEIWYQLHWFLNSIV